MAIHKFLYLNTHLFKGTLPAFFYRKLQHNDLQRCIKICDYITSKDFDVVMLSEVWSFSMRMFIAGRLIHTYPYFYIPPKDGRWYTIGPEQVILSKTAISEESYENLNCLSGWDQFSVKKICSCVVNNKFICTTHFDTGMTSENLSQLKCYIQKYSGNREVIFAGDMNIGETTQSGENVVLCDRYIGMRDNFAILGMLDSDRILHPNFIENPNYTVDCATNEVANHFSGGGNDKSRIDYYFTRSVVPMTSSVVQLPLSDHYGITLTII